VQHVVALPVLASRRNRRLCLALERGAPACPASLMSRPAQKKRPVPVMIITRRSSESPKRHVASSST
jgi:hypothetical protein